MLKTSNLLKFFLILSPLLIHAEEKKETTPTVEAAKTIAEEIVKKEKINFLNDKIALEEKLLKDLKTEQEKTDLKDAAINEKIKIKETDILNTKNELAALVSSKNTFFKNVKEKLNTCKQKISNRTYVVFFGKTVGALALVAGIGYAIKTYVEKKNTPAE
jgi:hypothetical protein